MPEKTPPRRSVFTAKSMGFCNGVRRALDFVRRLQEDNPGGQRIYIYNEIVHNNFIVNELKQNGVVFVHSLDGVPENSVVIWSAHGVPPQLEAEAQLRKLKVVDATCPLVKHLHELASRHSQAGSAVIFIGHKQHPETVGVLGCGNIYCVSNAEDCAALPDFEPDRKVVVLTQTTWCTEDVAGVISALRQRYPELEFASGICYATSERQQAVRELISRNQIELLLVIGSPRSSNSNRLCEVAAQAQIPARLIDDPAELLTLDLSAFNRIGLTAGASAPEILIERSLTILEKNHHCDIYKG